MHMITPQLLLASVWATMAATPQTLHDWKQWGIAGAVIAYVFWRDWDREKRHGQAMKEQQAFINGKLVALIEANNTAINELKSRPCLVDAVFKGEEP